MIIWISGNSGAGKTTLAEMFKTERTIHLDGDEMRQSISKDLGFSREDRIENNLRIARLAMVLERQHKLIVVSTICPYRELREEIKQMTGCIFFCLAGGKTGPEYPYEMPEWRSGE